MKVVPVQVSYHFQCGECSGICKTCILFCNLYRANLRRKGSAPWFSVTKDRAVPHVSEVVNPDFLLTLLIGKVEGLTYMDGQRVHVNRN